MSLQVSSTPDRAYVVVAATGGGHGDHIFALKTALLIREMDPFAPLGLLTLDPRANAFLRDQISPDSNIECFNARSAEEIIFYRKINDLSMQVFGIGCAIIRLFQLECLLSDIKNPTMFCIREYGVSELEENMRVAGLDKNEAGIFIDRRLVAYARDERFQNSFERLSLLGLCLRDSIAGRMSLEEYDAANALFFAYGSSTGSFVFFADYLCEKHGNGLKNIDIACVNANNKFLDIAGLNKEKLFQVYVDSELRYENQDMPQGKKLRFITMAALSHEDMLELIMASERDCMVTGDQSFSEVLSANKIFVYECLSHKKKFFNSIIDFCCSKFLNVSGKQLADNKLCLCKVLQSKDSTVSSEDVYTCLHNYVIAGRDIANELPRILLEEHALQQGDGSFNLENLDVSYNFLHRIISKRKIDLDWFERFYEAYPERILKNAAELAICATANNVDICKFIVTTIPDCINCKDKNNTVLHAAVKSRDADLVRFLLASNARVDIAGECGNSVLHESKLMLEIARMLLDAGVNPNFSNNNGKTPLFWAARFENMEVLELLLERGADPAVVDCDYNNIFHQGESIAHNLSVVKMLGEAGTSFLDVNNKGKMAFHVLWRYASAEVADYMLEKLKTLFGDSYERKMAAITPLHEAVKSDNKILVSRLLEKGFDINSVNMDGDTPLHIAVEQPRGGRLKLIELLCSKGANVFLKNRKGFTPFAKVRSDRLKKSGLWKEFEKSFLQTLVSCGDKSLSLYDYLFDVAGQTVDPLDVAFECGNEELVAKLEEEGRKAVCASV